MDEVKTSLERDLETFFPPWDTLEVKPSDLFIWDIVSQFIIYKWLARALARISAALNKSNYDSFKTKGSEAGIAVQDASLRMLSLFFPPHLGEYHTYSAC